MGRLSNQYLTEKRGRGHWQHVYKLTRARVRAHTHTHTHTLFSSLSRCQNDCLGFCGRRHISFRLNKPSGPRQCFQPPTRDWIIQSDVNQRQAKSDKVVDLINTMVLMLTCLITKLIRWSTLSGSDTAVRSTVVDADKRPNQGVLGVWILSMRACPVTNRTPLMAGSEASREMLNGHSN